jgi:positive regulator of sigma E activity
MTLPRIAARAAAFFALLAIPAGLAAQDSPHGELPPGMDCAACHTSTGWVPALETMDFVHGAVSGFTLRGEHETLTCAQCHTDLRFDAPNVQADDCAQCHTDVHDGQIIDDCVSCHTETSFQVVDGQEIHARTALPLEGAHLELTCESCHSDEAQGLYAGIEASCLSCHAEDYAQSEILDHEELGYSTDCVQCHTTLAWSDAPLFDHLEVAPEFALLGAHENVSCSGCHVEPGMELIHEPESVNDCVSCHLDDYQFSHPSGNLSTDCLQCHNVNSWSVSNFDHTLTGFSLLGAHARTDCASCHVNGHDLRWDPPADEQDCVVCHMNDYNEEHAGSGYPLTCASCHNTNDWDDADFNHDDTGFSLVGSHESATCTSCHSTDGTLLFVLPQSNEDCVVCHQSDYDVHHAGSGYPLACIDCHTQSAFVGATFDHDDTGFSLVGSHESATCTSCHTDDGGLLFPTPSSNEDCVVCHQTDYDANHAGTGYPLNCLECHTQSTWEGATFDHLEVSGFALVGAHETALCTTCHTDDGGLLFATPESSEDCATCHQDDYDANHTGTGFPLTCLDCHTQTTWQGAVFDHGAETGFALVGAHEGAACTTCHAEDNSLLYPQPQSNEDCVSCHQSDYDSNHAGSGFPTTCLDCHTQTTWQGAVFDHAAQTGFALVGAHETAECSTCHAEDNSLLFPTPSSDEDCVVCHQSDYDSEHAGSGFPTTCLDCHNQTDWDDATFDHASATGFALIGAHETASCSSCHGPDNSLLFSTPGSDEDCVVCHQADYDANHAGSGFSTTCLDCHSQTSWEGATFDHDARFFPIFSGEHRGKWDNCSDCHTSAPSDYSDFTCLECHAHNQTSMDAEHARISGYSYDSPSCLSCHPTGSD